MGGVCMCVCVYVQYVGYVGVWWLTAEWQQSQDAQPWLEWATGNSAKVPSSASAIIPTVVCCLSPLPPSSFFSDFFPASRFQGVTIGEGQKGRDRNCQDRASLSRPLVLSLKPLTSLTSFPLFCTSEDMNGRGRVGGLWQNGVGGEGDRFVMTFSDVFLPVPFLASAFDLHRNKQIVFSKQCF